MQVGETLHFLGVDGGGTRCRARLADSAGTVLGEGVAGPANLRLGLKEAFRAVLDATGQCLVQAGLSLDDQIFACLALAGASEPAEAAAAQAYGEHRFPHLLITPDAHAACVGAHCGRDGGVVVVGTGSIGWAVHGGRQFRVGGWGFPVSDEGSGAWLGCEVVRRALRALDGRTGSTSLLKCTAEEFGSDPHAIVRWMGSASPRDFASLAPLVVEHAARGDPSACELMRTAGTHIDALAAGLAARGVVRLALAGGLAASIEPWLGAETRARLVAPAADALEGALQLARGLERARTELLGAGSRAAACGRDDKRGGT